MLLCMWKLERGTMKALSIKQPWAQLIADRIKTVEIRTWRTNYRGQLAIAVSNTREQYTRWPKIARKLYQGPISKMPLGCVIAVADLVDCRVFEPWDEVRAVYNPPTFCYSWKLENVRKLSNPVRVIGQLGIYNLDDDVSRIVTEQI